MLAEAPAASPDVSVADALVADALVANVLAEAPAASPDANGAEELGADVLAAVPTTPPDGSNADALVANVRSADAVVPVEIYGDASYGTAEFVEAIEGAGAEANVKGAAAFGPRWQIRQGCFRCRPDQQYGFAARRVRSW